MKKYPDNRIKGQTQGLSPKTQQRIAERAGYSLLKLHDLWCRGSGGDEHADQELKALIKRRPEISKLVDRFVAGSKHFQSNNGRHAAITTAVIFKNTESLWTSAKSKWVSVKSGGLPSLGKRN